LLNNINNKENNSKPEKGHSDKTTYVETFYALFSERCRGRNAEKKQ